MRSCRMILSKEAYVEGSKEKKEIEDLLCVLNLNLSIGFIKLGVGFVSVYKAFNNYWILFYSGDVVVPFDYYYY